MTITFVEKRKRLRYLVPVLIIVIIITAIVWWQSFFVKEKPVLEPTEVVPSEDESVKKIEINYEIFKHPLLEELQPFEEVESFKGEVGRENPFIPY